jgi:hypothetical protein
LVNAFMAPLGLGLFGKPSFDRTHRDQDDSTGANVGQTPTE